MNRTIHGNSQGLTDVRAFVGLINDPPPELQGFFREGADIVVTRAPGRLDVMGGIADYSGSLVLQMPIAEATLAAAQKTEDETIEIISIDAAGGGLQLYRSSVSDIPAEINYEVIRGRFAAEPENHWASYAAGVFYVLKRELGFAMPCGIRILISSQVPVGKGVSSSAALEVAVMQAVRTVFGISIDDRSLALLCQKVENHIVGAACGVMDQMTANCGVEKALLSLVCQPTELGDPIRIPAGVEFWGIDSGVRHAVAGSDYTSVRVGAFMGYRIIAGVAGLKADLLADGSLAIDDLRWRGFLANVTPDEYRGEFAAALPVSLSGRDFLTRFKATTDSVTTVDPEKIYAIRAPAEHAIYESSRVRAFAGLLRGVIDDGSLHALGELMFASHRSYAKCGLTEERTNRLVELVRRSGESGLFGARITGGGSGGTVVVLARAGSRDAIEKIADQFGAETGRRPHLFHGSSPGCAAFGHLRISRV